MVLNLNELGTKVLEISRKRRSSKYLVDHYCFKLQVVDSEDIWCNIFSQISIFAAVFNRRCASVAETYQIYCNFDIFAPTYSLISFGVVGFEPRIFQSKPLSNVPPEFKNTIGLSTRLSDSKLLSRSMAIMPPRSEHSNCFPECEGGRVGTRHLRYGCVHSEETRTIAL